MRLAIVGKGGAGKSLLAGTLARVIARRGHRVLALDSDPLPGLTFSLGAEAPEALALGAAVEFGSDRRWRFVHGVGPVRAVQRYATDAPDGVRLLQAGKTGPGGQAPMAATVFGFYMVIHGLSSAAAFRDWAFVGDLPAGPYQLAYNWAPYAERFVLVVEPTWQSMLTARRIKRIVTTARPGVAVSLVVNKVAGQGDAARVGSYLALPVLGAVPVDEGVRAAELAGVALIDFAPEGPAVRAVEELTDRLHGDRLG
jgi:CO dehydrogenase maturation factor